MTATRRSIQNQINSRRSQVRPISAPFPTCLFRAHKDHCTPCTMDSDAAQLPLSDRLLAWFETNKKQALWGAVIILAAGLLIGFLSWRKNEKEIEAGQA